ncbi:hypothetical protein CMQ_395 [Grosmannia clavigera kw1407]|uniref:Uncharacterized protein n=1 Tax=Grosmannia clavigera (strain kw1407 / UAMH 11150) TaxID=655863 RepID=F0XED1_GROCL|nr:uncharacterized protein CMQ_395 [Grosmannia clavigera kw1407]EFX03467.1 hypothetical protein CMQ_395 [Grosmannia clavigera kw1407]
MSVTTTATRTSLRPVLADYETYRSDPQPAIESVESTAMTSPAAHINTPPSWPTDHRRVPPYRPVNRELDLSQRMAYNNGIEHAFISTMFFGIRVVTVFHRTWRATGGKMNDRIFHYELGGEY